MERTSLNTTGLPQAFVFMKVGNHAGESFEQILERKNWEYRKTGRIFWGYGGTSCHPLTQVQPFARSAVQQYGAVYLLMEPIDSRAEPDVLPATEYSEDGLKWQPIPEGIQVIGSRYALILNEIVPGDLDLHADDFVVGVGPSRGKRGGDYLQGRIDKACLTYAGPAVAAQSSAVQKIVKYKARLLEPYAVMLK
jgi:hypothetical protein